jgi:hypothetical protein
MFIYECGADECRPVTSSCFTSLGLTSIRVQQPTAFFRFDDGNMEIAVRGTRLTDADTDRHEE